MSTIDDLERKVRSLGDQLNAARASLREARLAEYPIKPGDVVKDRSGEEFRVTYVSVNNYGSFEVEGNDRKKNGEWSIRRRIVYNAEPT